MFSWDVDISLYHLQEHVDISSVSEAGQYLPRNIYADFILIFKLLDGILFASPVILLNVISVSSCTHKTSK